MAEPATYAGYKVGTLLALMMGAGVSVGLTPGPWYLRLFAGASGAAVAFVATPIAAPLTTRMFQILYGWAGVPVSAMPIDGVVGVTGFGLALIGIDACRFAIDWSKKVASKLPLPWSKPKG